jgi:excisionase family DNA binding protein
MADLSDVRFLTVAEVAEMMRVSNMTVYRLVQSGKLPAVRFGRSYRIPESAVAAAIELPDAQVG